MWWTTKPPSKCPSMYGYRAIKQAFDNVKFLSRRGQPADEKAFITDEMTEEELERRLAGFPVEAVIKVASY